MSKDPSALPPEFISRMREELGTESEDFFAAHQVHPVTSILLNPLKNKGIDVDALEGARGVPWNLYGRYLEERPKFIRDPLYHSGTYYSQEASSMLISKVLEQYSLSSGARCLDLCAAPGGKSLVLLNALPGNGLLVSNEISRSRASILDENLLKWGNPSHALCSSDAARIGAIEDAFDLILVDAPCSGEGMFRKDKVAIREWTPGHVASCGIRQKGILGDILPALKPGGVLVYSTCTYSQEENAWTDQFLIEKGLLPLPVSIEPEWGFTSTSPEGHAYQAYLHKVRGEGFYMAAYRKRGEGNSSFEYRTKELFLRHKSDLPDSNLPNGYVSVEWKDQVYALREEHEVLLGEMNDHRLLKRPGLPLGQWKRKDFIPSIATALCPGWAAAEMIELDLERAWSFLRGETPDVKGPAKGWTLIGYKGSPLSWVKWVNSRMKNHYPKEWRIRSRW